MIESVPATPDDSSLLTEPGLARRIFGLESELATQLIVPGLSRPPDTNDAARRLLRRALGPELKHSNAFLPNGCRLYLDVGEHIEYATPECDSVLTLVAAEKAGERRLAAAARRVTDDLQPEYSGRKPVVYVIKNNVDGRGCVYGAHENYLTLRFEDNRQFGRLLSSFWATRHLIVGAGHVASSADSIQFVLSQRADHTFHETQGSTTRDRPMVNTRDEPLAMQERYRRLHVIVGDANMCELGTFLKFGTAHLALRLLEDGRIPLTDLILENAVLALRTSSHDTTLQRTVMTRDGRFVRPIEIQMKWAEKAQQLLEQSHASAEEQMFVSEWLRVLDALDTDPMSLAGELDWPTKYWYLNERIMGADVAPQVRTQKAKGLDFLYHDIDQDRGLYYLMTRAGFTRRLVGEDVIQLLIDNPPPTTRAAIRGSSQWVNTMVHGGSFGDWRSVDVGQRVRTGQTPPPRKIVDDPFRSIDVQLEQRLTELGLEEKIVR